MLENLLWALELSQQCENSFDKIVLQSVGCLLSDSIYGGAHTQSLPDLLQPKPLPPHQATADRCLHRRHPNTQKQVWLSLLRGPCILGAHTVLFEPQLELDMEHQQVPNWERSTSRLHIVTLLI